MVEKPSILHIASWFPNRIHPTNGNFIEKHIQLMQDEYTNVVLAVQRDDALRPFQLQFEEREKGKVKILLVYFGGSKIINGGLGWALFKVPAFIKGLKRIFKNHPKFDIIHNHVLLDAGIFAYITSWYKGIPFVVTEHATIYQTESPNGLSWLSKRLIRLIARHARLIMPVSNNLADQLRKLELKASFKVLPNVVNTSLFIPKPSQKQDLKVRFLHISSFHEAAKNISGMIHAIKILAVQGENFSFTFAGDGDLNHLKALLEGNMIAPSYYKLIGTLDEKGVAKLMQQHDVFVLFSNYETFSVVAAEAQACGLPLIVTDLPILRERVVDERFGKWVPQGRVEQLIQVMSWMITNYKSYDASIIRSFAINSYSQEVVFTQISEAYDAVLNQDG